MKLRGREEGSTMGIRPSSAATPSRRSRCGAGIEMTLLVVWSLAYLATGTASVKASFGGAGFGLDFGGGTRKVMRIRGGSAGVGMEDTVPDDESAIADTALGWKAAGNKKFGENHYGDAVRYYTRALQHEPLNVGILCNRALAHTKQENYGLAIMDAQTCIATDSRFAKGFYRKGTAELGLGKFKEALKDFRVAYSLRPNDRDALSKLKHCESMVRRQAFEAAIRTEDEPSPFIAVDWKEMELDDGYEGAQWEGEKITTEFVESVVSGFKEGKRLQRRYMYRLLVEMKQILEELPNVVEAVIEKGHQMTVCGDTHGQFYDLMNIFELNGVPSESNPYVFNGDFVDRGSWSVEVITSLFLYKRLYPDSVHLTRGNHETTAMNKVYGFEGEVSHKHSKHVYDCYVETFRYLPLAVTLNSNVFICHGGLFSEDGVTIDDIKKVNRVVEPANSGILCDILWSDPQEALGRSGSKRGIGCCFGPDVTARWLKENNMKLLVRSHEMKEEGYDVQHDGKCVTIFSAPNYCDQMGNKGAFIRFGHDCLPHFTRFGASPHPDVKPMAYSPIEFGGI